LKLRRTDVLSAWSGIRPLAADPHAKVIYVYIYLYLHICLYVCIYIYVYIIRLECLV
jgi:hypothetical protein